MLDATSRLLIAGIGVLGISVVSFVAYDGANEPGSPAASTARADRAGDTAKPAVSGADTPEPARPARQCERIAGGTTNAGAFIATFDGAPPAPLGLCGLTGWDLQVHSRDTGTWTELEPMEAQHGSDCVGPPAAHENHTYEGAVFQCRDHLMTALRASGYGEIMLTPGQLLDFSDRAATVSFDISTERMSTRDWWDIWISPYADNVALPFDEGEVDLAGAPRNAVHISIQPAEGTPVLTVYTDGAGTGYGDRFGTPSSGQGIKAGTNEAATRQPFKLTLSRTHVRLERQASPTGSAVVFFDEEIPALAWAQGVVQFGHHSYNPAKDGAGVPATWHWDNIALAPAIPFVITPANQRYTEGPREPITFASPAPANATLRFAAIGTVELSFDGGPFQAAEKQWASANGDHPEHFSSYWTPIPEGTRSVSVRFTKDAWYEGPYLARDFHIWARP